MSAVLAFPDRPSSVDALLAEMIAVAVQTAAQKVAAGDGPAESAKGLYRYREAAQWLGASETKVREWVDRGYIESVQFDSCVRIPHESLVTFKAMWRARGEQ